MKKLYVLGLVTVLSFLLQGCAGIRTDNVSKSYSIRVEASTKDIIVESLSHTSVDVESLVKRVNQKIEAKLLEAGFRKDLPELVLNYNIDFYGFSHLPGSPFDRMISRYTISVINPKTSKTLFTQKNMDAETDSMILIDEMAKSILNDGINGAYDKL